MRTMKLVLSIAAIAVLSAGSSLVKASSFADMSGTYVGSMAIEGQGAQPTELQLKQEGDKVTGKIGGPDKPEEMLPLTGEVDGDTVSFTAKPPQGEMKIEFKLTLAEDRLKGPGTFTIGDMPVKVTLDLKKK